MYIMLVQQSLCNAKDRVPRPTAMNFEWYEDFRVIIPQRLEPKRHRQRTSSQCAFFLTCSFIFSLQVSAHALGGSVDVTLLEIEKL